MVTDISIGDILTIKDVLENASMENMTFYTLEGNIVCGITGYEEFYPKVEQLKELSRILQ